MIRINKLLE